MYTPRRYSLKNCVGVGILVSICFLMLVSNAKMVMGDPVAMNSDIVKTLNESDNLAKASDLSFANATAESVVEVISIETGRGYEEDWRSYYYFFHEEEMVAKMTARNGANVTKTATFYVGAFDDLGQFFYSYSEDFTFSAEEIKMIYLPIYVQDWLLSGNQCAITSIAKTLPEGAYCPEKTMGFFLLPIAPVRDTSVVNVTTSTNEVYVGWKINIVVVVENQGNITESFAVTVKYELEGVERVIDVATVKDLSPYFDAALTFTWTTEDVSLHTIIAETSVLLGETDTADNILQSPTRVKVKITGDVNGDYLVNMKDISLAALAFGSKPGDSRWTTQADIDQNAKINMYDVAVIASNFGSHHP